jgi:hypothetical protein
VFILMTEQIHQLGLVALRQQLVVERLKLSIAHLGELLGSQLRIRRRASDAR